MFSAIKDALARRRLNKAMSRYISEDVMEDILKTKDADSLRALSNRQICFVLIELNTTDLPALESMLSTVTEIASAHDGVIDTLVSHLVVVCFGVLDWSPINRHKTFIESILSKFGGQIKIAYASGVGQVGNIGGPKRMSYSFIHPMFPRALAELSAMPYGEAHEVL